MLSSFPPTPGPRKQWVKKALLSSLPCPALPSAEPTAWRTGRRSNKALKFKMFLWTLASEARLLPAPHAQPHRYISLLVVWDEGVVAGWKSEVWVRGISSMGESLQGSWLLLEKALYVGSRRRLAILVLRSSESLGLPFPTCS